MALQVRLQNRVVDLSAQFLAGGHVRINRIDNGFLVSCVTVRCPLPAAFGPVPATDRTFYCATVDDLLHTLGVLMQLPWRAPEGEIVGHTDSE